MTLITATIRTMAAAKSPCLGHPGAVVDRHRVSGFRQQHPGDHEHDHGEVREVVWYCGVKLRQTGGVGQQNVITPHERERDESQGTFGICEVYSRICEPRIA